MTVRSLPLKRTFAPLEVGCRPSPASITPDLTSSSLYFVIASRSSVLGISPASDSGLPGTRTMKRIGVSLWWMGWFLPARRTRSVEIDTVRIFMVDVRGSLLLPHDSERPSRGRVRWLGLFLTGAPVGS